MKPCMMMVDGYSLLFRGFHALPLLTAPDGTYTNAIHGFFSMLLKALSDYHPDGLAVMLDVHAPTFRHSMYADYKGNRKPMPEELRPQTELLRRLLRAMDIQIYEMEGYEGDDLLGTVSRLANEAGQEAIVLTGDRDSLQLAGNGTKILLTRKGISESLLLDAEGVLAEYGFTPEQVPDMKGLMGDSSDHIPGIAGVGEKTALKLMQEYGSLDNVLSHADQIKGRLGEKIRAGREDALLSRELGRIHRNAPVRYALENCGWNHMADAAPLLEQYGLYKILTGIRSLCGGGETLRATEAAKRASGRTSLPASAMAVEAEIDLPKSVKPKICQTIADHSSLQSAAEELQSRKPEWIALYTDSAEISLFLPSEELFRIPLGGDLLTPGLYAEDVLTVLAPLLHEIPVILHDAKACLHHFDAHQWLLPKIGFDTMLAAYLLHTAQKNYGLNQSLAAEYGEVPKQVNAAVLYSLAQRQQARLKARGMEKLLLEMEQPLSAALFHMEKEGFLVDRNVLSELGTLFTREAEESREAVYDACQFRDFNLNSPKQLGEVLFERLKLPCPQKKGKTGFSTSAEVLEELDHPCIEPLLRYRRMSKLQGTYIEGLSKLQGADGRIHTTFDQTAAVTGRISSQEPNLQNIPIRTEEGREIRRAFIAGEGKILLDADYSQIELRLLAHMSEDAAMCDAFCRGQDIHARTASEINGVPIEAVTGGMRRNAKAVNFGIVYGISAFGLSRNTGISRSEAKRFIDLYFERYPGVKRFMTECVCRGSELGYAETLFGRRRELFELRSPNRNLRSFGERAAMNTPVQGSAADIIKMAMIQVDEELRKGGYQAKLILQVHDELVIECPPEEADVVSALMKQCMENVITLRVPLVADVSRGHSWDETH